MLILNRRQVQSTDTSVTKLAKTFSEINLKLCYLVFMFCIPVFLLHSFVKDKYSHYYNNHRNMWYCMYETSFKKVHSTMGTSCWLLGAANACNKSNLNTSFKQMMKVSH